MMKPGNRNSAEYTLETTDIAATLTLLNEQAALEQVDIQNLLAKVIENGHSIRFRAVFGSGHLKKRRQRFFNALVTAPETKSLHHSEQEVHSKL